MTAPELLEKFDMLGLVRPAIHDIKGNSASVKEWRDSHYFTWPGAPASLKKGDAAIVKGKLWLILSIDRDMDSMRAIVSPTTWQNFLIHHWMHGRLPIPHDRVEIEARALRMVIDGETELPTEFFFESPQQIPEARHFVTTTGKKVQY